MSRVSSSTVFCRAATAACVSLLLAGCGNQYRPVVTATNPVGPAAQPTKYAAAISIPTSSAGGLVSFIDFSGDTVITTPTIQPNPSYIALSGNGQTGYTINSAGTLDEFPSGNPTGLLTSQIITTTLPASSTAPIGGPSNISVVALSGSSADVFVPEPGRGNIAALTSTGQLIQEVGVQGTPQYVVGADGAARIYALSSTGVASSIESSTTAGLSVTGTIPVGTNPVYGVMTGDDRRAFILNKGSESISVINAVNNTLDAGVNSSLNTTTYPNYVTTTGTINLPKLLDANGADMAANPVWADLSPLTGELVVLSAGSGTSRGSVAIFNISLCNASAQPNNPNCNASNPIDAAGFGTLLSQVPVGMNPTQISVLNDGTRAYVANSGNSTTPGSVSVVNLVSGVVTATLPSAADSTALSTPAVFGHPTTIVATTGTPTGKVYVTSSDSQYLSIIYTDSDTVVTHAPLQGNGVRVVVTAP